MYPNPIRGQDPCTCLMMKDSMSLVVFSMKIDGVKRWHLSDFVCRLMRSAQEKASKPEKRYSDDRRKVLAVNATGMSDECPVAGVHSPRDKGTSLNQHNVTVTEG